MSHCSSQTPSSQFLPPKQPFLRVTSVTGLVSSSCFPGGTTLLRSLLLKVTTVWHLCTPSRSHFGQEMRDDLKLKSFKGNFRRATWTYFSFRGGAGWGGPELRLGCSFLYKLLEFRNKAVNVIGYWECKTFI